MGKTTRNKKSAGIALENPHPGCMWSLFHVLKYHHWSHVKKRIPHRRLFRNRHDAENINDDSDPDKRQDKRDSQMYDCAVEGQMLNPSPATKKSVRARIKARISEEFTKKKGKRHHRSSTCPVQLNRTSHNQDLESPDRHPLSKMNLDSGSPRTLYEKEGDSSGTTSLHGVSNCCDEDHADVHEKLDNKKRIEEILMQAKDVASDASFNQPKEFLDASEIMNIHKELYAKILHDPGSSMAHQFNNQQENIAKTQFCRSGSFPLPASDKRIATTSIVKKKQDGSELHKKEDWKMESGSEALMLPKQKPTEIPAVPTKNVTGEMQKKNQAKDDNADDLPSASLHPLQKRSHNQRVKKRFKDLRKKVKHVIKERKNEKDPITMDAILHKIPHGQMSSKEAREDVIDRLKSTATGIIGKESPKNRYEDYDAASSPGQDGQRSMKRTVSLCKSLEKYRQLYESSFSREAKQPVSEGLKLKKEDTHATSDASKSLGRIFSLPNLKYYPYQSDDSSISFPPRTLSKAMADDAADSGSSSPEKRSGIDAKVSDDSLRLDSVLSVVGSSTVSDVQDLLRDTGTNLVARDHGKENIYHPDEEDIGLEEESRDESREPDIDTDMHKDKISSSIYSEDIELSPSCLSLEEPDYLGTQDSESRIVTPEVADDRIDIGKAEALSSELEDRMLRIQVDMQSKAEFDYVRDVLELSGFSRNEFLGMWHSDDQPVDPSLFGEADGCLFHDPDCPGNEEGGNCSHLLLFDLINHILMEIYERSCSYYPRSLSSLSHIHPVPVGYHVLEEVWALVSWYLSYKPESDQSLDYVASKDLSKNDDWMNLQYDTECVALELEDWIFDDLLDEMI